MHYHMILWKSVEDEMGVLIANELDQVAKHVHDHFVQELSIKLG